MEKRFEIPLSTLKLNAKILRELNLIEWENSFSPRLTELGRFVVAVLGGDSE